MNRSGIRWLLYTVLAALVVLHNDIWFWDDATIVLGLPVGLTYHIAFCVAASILMSLMIRFAWPERLEGEDGEETRG